MIQAILWDMDGVLIDSEPFYARSIRNMYNALGAPLTVEMEQAMVGSSAMINARRVLECHPHLNMTADELFLLHQQALVDGLKQVERLIEGVETWLERTRNQGIKHAVATSSTGEMLAWATQKLRLDELFDTIVTSSDVANAKPHPDIFLEAARRLGAPPEHCLVIEDSINGVRAARAAGMRVAVFTGAPGMGVIPDDGDFTFSCYDGATFDMIFG